MATADGLPYCILRRTEAECRYRAAVDDNVEPLGVIATKGVIFAMSIIEHAPGQQTGAVDLEEIGTGDDPAQRRSIAGNARQGDIIDIVFTAAADGTVADGHGTDRLQIADGGDDRAGLGAGDKAVASGKQHHQSITLEAEVRLPDMARLRDQYTGADHEGDGKAELEDDQPFANAGADTPPPGERAEASTLAAGKRDSSSAG
jgi:hypothetical protein